MATTLLSCGWKATQVVAGGGGMNVVILCTRNAWVHIKKIEWKKTGCVPIINLTGNWTPRKVLDSIKFHYLERNHIKKGKFSTRR